MLEATGASPDPTLRREPDAAAAAGATRAAAAAALRRPRLARLDRRDKARVRREVIRMRLHTCVQRELTRHNMLTSAVFGASLPGLTSPRTIMEGGMDLADDR